RQAAAETANIADVRSASEVRQHDIAARVPFAHLHETEPHEIERVGRISLTDDDLARRVAQQLDAIAQVGDELLRHRGEDGNAPDVRLERALAVLPIELRAERLVLL